MPAGAQPGRLERSEYRKSDTGSTTNRSGGVNGTRVAYVLGPASGVINKPLNHSDDNIKMNVLSRRAAFLIGLLKGNNYDNCCCFL